MTTNEKQVLKRLLSLTLAVVMCLSFLPVSAQAADFSQVLTNGKPVTVENVEKLIEEYKNGTREPGEKAKAAGFTTYQYKVGEYDPYNPPYYIAGLGSGTECAKFAFAFWDDIFGDAPYRKVTDPQQVRPGDLVHYPTHWFIATKNAYSSPYFDVPCTQEVGGGSAGSIGWDSIDRPIDFSDTEVYTRYPLPYEFEDSEVYLTATGPIGTPLASLDGLDSVRLWASKEGESKDFDLPIIWDESSYNPWTNDEQTVEGKLDISDYPELAGSTLPPVTATVTLEGEVGIKEVTIQAPGTTTGKVGDTWETLNIPDELTATITYADGNTETESVSIQWDITSYRSNTVGFQTIHGEILNFEPNGILSGDDAAEWAEKLRSEGVDVSISLQNFSTGITVLGEPFEATGFLGDAFSALTGVPDTINVMPQLASGVTLEEPWEVMVDWDTSTYNPLEEDQTITGKLNFNGYVEEFPETTVTLHITLTPNPNDAVDSITLISPLTISGIQGAAFDQQPLPEKVTVRVTYVSGRTSDLEADVTWDSSEFDSSTNGTQQVSGTVSFSNGEIPEDTDPAKLNIAISINLQVRGTGITVQEIAPLKGYLGTSVDEFKSRAPELLIATVTTSTGATPEYELPVNWDWSTFDSTLEEQVIHGTLVMSGDPSIEALPSPDVQLRILLSEKPTYTADFEKTYDGKQTPLPVEKPEGCTGVSIRYAGTTFAGATVQGTYPPSAAGTYTATVTLTMAPGYDPIDSLTVNYVINQKEQPFDTPVKVVSMSDSVAATPIDGVEYRIDDGEWQSSPVFTGLKPETTYTVYQRLKASNDGNYKASEPTSVQVTTSKVGSTSISVQFTPRFSSKTYDGTGLLDGVSNGRYDLTFGGNTVRVTVSAFLSSDLDAASAPLNFEEAHAVKNPTTAGPYVFRYTLPNGYVWADTGEQTICDGVWIYPRFSDVYVGDTLTDITMEGGTPDSNSASANLQYEFVLPDNPATFDFDTSHTGSTMVPVGIISGGSSVSMAASSFPVTVLPWIVTEKDVPTVKLANDASFDSSMLPATVAVTAKAHDKEQTFQVPVTWNAGEYDDSKDANTISGTLNFSGIPELNGSDDTSVSVVVTRLAAPVYVSAGEPLADRTYDGTGLFDAGKDYTVTAGDVEITVQRTAYLVSDDSAAENPTAAGKYRIHSVLPEGYLWEGTTSQERDETVWIYPAVKPIYVGETLSSSDFETGSSAYSFSFGSNPGFDSSVSGEKSVSVIAASGDSTETITLDISVLPWVMTGKKTVEMTGKYGTAFDALNLPATVKVTAKGSGDEREFDVPVIWSNTGYDSYAETQTIEGTLNFSSIPELSGQTDTAASAVVRLSMNEVPAPVMADFTKTYDGNSSPMPAPALPVGIDSCSISYSGTSFAGNAYGPSADVPVNAGEYTATVSFTMASGYAQLAPVEVPYTINKAAQAAPEAIGLVIASYDSIVLRAVDGAEYSKDGVAWQSENSFYGLNANTEYTMYLRMPATADGNYAPSDSLTMSVTTSKRDAQAPSLAPRTVTYSGEPQAYSVAAITGVQEAVVAYVQDGKILESAPVDAGEYDVSITFRMENGYKQLDSMTSKLTILKASQNAPAAALTAVSDTSLTISNLSGAEYSIDGGNTWQTSHTFTGLERNTQYTILVRLAADKNHNASPAVEVRASTTATTSEVPSMLPAYSVTYDGTAKEYPYAANLSDIAGVQSVTVTYTGTTNAGAGYRSTTPPTEAGQYAVMVTLTAKPGYVLAQSMIGSKMTIERAPQTLTEAPTIAKVTTATVTVNPIAGAEYSGNNGATWQTSNSFTGLAPQTSFIILVRLAETSNYLASETYSLPAQTLANTGLTYDIDFRNETIQFNEQVVEMSMTNFFSSTIPSGSAVTPGLMLFARLVDNGTGSAGSANNVRIPARPAAPDVKCDTATYIVNTTSAMEYSADNGDTWNPCEENMDASRLGGSVLLVRYAATDSSFRSDPANVFVPTRPAAPALTVNLVTERINTTSAMEFSADGGTSWQPCQPDMSAASLAGETIMVRTKANANSPASVSTFLNIPDRADVPEYTIQTSAELLTANVPFAYYNNGEWVEAEILRLSDLCGQTILIQAPSKDGKFASERISVAIPLRGETPVVEVEEQTLTINTAIGMEYSVDNGASWNAADVNMDISPYAGTTMLVRRAATGTMFASNSAVVRIRSLSDAPDVSVDNVREIVNTTAEMEYSTDAGRTWTPAPDELDVSSLTGGTLEIRVRGTETEFPSESVTVTIPVRNEAPEVSADMVSGQFSFPAGTQYSPDGGVNWMDAPSSIMESMYGTTLLFRTPADEAHFASVSVPVALSSRPDGPAVSFDIKNLSVNTTSAMEYSSDGGYNWTPAPDGLDASGLLGKTVLFRYAASGTTPASSTTALELPAGASAPSVSVDCGTEQLISSERTLEWSLDGGHTWSVCKTPMNVGDYAGRELLFRTPGTTETPASASVPVTIPRRESAPAVDVDTDAETINTTSAMEYSLNGGLSWTQAPMGLDVSQMTGEAVLVRTAHTGSSFASSAISVTVPTRAGSVHVSLDMEKEVLNTTSTMDYSLDNGRTWTQAPAGLNVSGMTGSAILIRNHGAGFQFASEPVTAAIPVRRETPSVRADLRSEIFSVSDGAEFSNDGGKTWTAVPASITAEMLGSTVLFRFPADETRFASMPVPVTLPTRPDGPTLSLDRDAMTVNTTSDMEIALDGMWAPVPSNMDVSGYQGQTLQFRYAATETTPASSVTELTVPAVTPAPVLSLDITNERIVSDEEGTVLEYSEDGGKTWTPCVMPMDIGHLAGKQVMFRKPADGETPSSKAVTATIPARAEKPAAVLDTAFEVVGTEPAEGISFSADGGETWTKLSGLLNISALTGKTILVRVSCTEDNLASEPAVVVIPSRNSAPASVIDMKAETASADSSMEYSMDGGRTWAPASETIPVSAMAGSSLMLRYAHTDEELHSETAVVAIPARLKAPEVSADVRSGKFNAPAGAEFSADGGKTWGEVPGITEDLYGKTVLFRLPATDRNFASATTSVTLSFRPGGPALVLNRETLTVNTDATMEYSVDNGDNWLKCVKDMSVSSLLGKTIIVRYAASKNAPASSETILVIPTRGSAPVVTAYNVTAYGRSDGVILGTSTGMEYRRTGTSAWTKVTGSSIGYLSAGTYEVRYAATASSLASESRFVTIYSPAPDQTNPGTNPGRPGNSNPGGGWYYPSYPNHGSNGSAGTSDKRYTVKFESNGGSSVKSQIVDRNGYAEAPQTPIKEGYTFLGWYTDAKLTKLYDFESKVKSSFTLYAGWTETYVPDDGGNSSNGGYVDPTPVDPTPVNPAPGANVSLVDGDLGISYVNGRAPGKFEPKASITRGEVAAILFRLMSENTKTRFYAQSNDFMDVSSDSWYNEAISTLVQAGVLGGYGDGTFRPDQPVTRAELAAILVRVQGGSESAGNTTFTDTDRHWAEGYISSAVTSGLVFGYDDGTFKPNRSITRAEAVTMMNRLLMRSPMDSSYTGSVSFTDVQPSDWFYGDVMAAANGYLG